MMRKPHRSALVRNSTGAGTLGFLGVLLLLSGVGFMVYKGWGILDGYLEYRTIVEAVEGYRIESGVPVASRIEANLERELEVEGVTPTALDGMDVRQRRGGMEVQLAYERIVPIGGHISLAQRFEDTLAIGG